MYNLNFDIKQIDSFAKRYMIKLNSVLIQNNQLKTYKIMINEDYAKTLSDFIINCHFSINCFTKNKLIKICKVCEYGTYIV